MFFLRLPNGRGTRPPRPPGWAIERVRDQAKLRAEADAFDPLGAQGAEPGEIVVVHAGERAYELADRVRAVPAKALFPGAKPMMGAGVE